MFTVIIITIITIIIIIISRWNNIHARLIGFITRQLA